MIKKLFAITILVFTFSALSSFSSAESNSLRSGASVVDLCGALSDDELSSLAQRADEVNANTGFNIAVLISGDVGADKSDGGVADYADVYYENLFGKDTDGILLLINEDTKYDYISTSGVCIEYYTDFRVYSMLDNFYSYISVGDRFGGALNFLGEVGQYYSDGIPSGQYTYETDEESAGIGEKIHDFIFSPVALIPLLLAALAALFFYKITESRYVSIKPYDKSSYFEQDSLLFTENTTAFVRTYTISNDSTSSHGGSRSGRSSSHRSSGGGSHGGGGRHR